MIAPRGTDHDLLAQMPFEIAGTIGRIEYNGFVFNDRRYPDRYRILSISGLDDPDLRDYREQNSDRDGEAAFDSFYGGRTITLRGYILAGDSFRLRAMWGQLKEAFDDTIDLPMGFLFGDWLEDWKGNWQQDYVYTVGAASNWYMFAPGVLAPTTGGSTLKALLSYKRHVDAKSILQWTNGPAGFGTTSNIGLIFRRFAPTSYVTVYYQNGTLFCEQTFSGSTTSVSSVAISASGANQTYWLRGIVEGSTVTAEIWSYEPLESGTPLATTSGTLVAGLGVGIEGISGFQAKPDTTASFVMETMRLDGLNAGDAQIICRKAGKFESEDSVDSLGRYRRDFLFAMRSPYPHFTSRHSRTQVDVITSAILSFPSSGGLIFPADGSGIAFGAPYPTQVLNLGRSPAYPVVRIYGPVTNPGIRCTNTDTGMGVNMTLSNGSQYAEFDVVSRTVVDQSGTELYDKTAVDSGWMLLGRGANDLRFGADSFTGGTTKVSIRYRHTSR